MRRPADENKFDKLIRELTILQETVEARSSSEYLDNVCIELDELQGYLADAVEDFIAVVKGEACDAQKQCAYDNIESALDQLTYLRDHIADEDEHKKVQKVLMLEKLRE